MTQTTRLPDLCPEPIAELPGHGHQSKSNVIDATWSLIFDVRRILDEGVGHENGEDPDGYVDVKDPAPRIVIGNPTAKCRSDNRGDHDTETKYCHGRAALLSRKTLHQNSLRYRLESTAPSTLGNSRDDQHAQARRSPAKGR